MIISAIFKGSIGPKKDSRSDGGYGGVSQAATAHAMCHGEDTGDPFKLKDVESMFVIGDYPNDG